jgi:hypothetical protein
VSILRSVPRDVLLSCGESREELNDAVLLTVNEVPPLKALVVLLLVVAAVPSLLLLLRRLLDPASSKRCDFSLDNVYIKCLPFGKTELSI